MLGFKKMNKQVACATSLDCSSHVELQPAADLNLFNHAELIWILYSRYVPDYRLDI